MRTEKGALEGRVLAPDPEISAIAQLVSAWGSPEDPPVKLNGLRKRLTAPFQGKSHIRPRRHWEFHGTEKMKSPFKVMPRSLI